MYLLFKLCAYFVKLVCSASSVFCSVWGVCSFINKHPERNIYDFLSRFFFSSSQYWHKGCFSCEVCKMALSMTNYKGFEKKPYCSM